MLIVDNEIITVYAQRSEFAHMAGLDRHPCPPLQELVNAATVLWRIEVLSESRTLASMLPLIVTVTGIVMDVGVHYWRTPHG